MIKIVNVGGLSDKQENDLPYDDSTIAELKEFEGVFTECIQESPEQIRELSGHKPIVDFLGKNGNEYTISFTYESTDFVEDIVGSCDNEIPTVGLCRIRLEASNPNGYDIGCILNEVVGYEAPQALNMLVFLNGDAYANAELCSLAICFKQLTSAEDRFAFIFRFESGCVFFNKERLRKYILDSLGVDPSTDEDDWDEEALTHTLAKKMNSLNAEDVEEELLATIEWLRMIAMIFSTTPIRGALFDLLEKSLPKCNAVFDFIKDFLLLPLDFFYISEQEDGSFEDVASICIYFNSSYSLSEATLKVLAASGNLEIDDGWISQIVYDAYHSSDFSYGGPIYIDGSTPTTALYLQQNNDSLTSFLRSTLSFFDIRLIPTESKD